MKFTERFKQFMKEFGFDEKSFSKIMNTSEKRVLKWLEGKSYPRASELFKIVQIFNCDADYLLGIRDNK